MLREIDDRNSVEQGSHSVQAIYSAIEGVKSQTVNVNTQDGVKTLLQKTVVVFGRDKTTNKPHVFVVPPQIAYDDYSKLEKAQRALRSKGIRGINSVVRSGRISEAEADDLELEMKVAGVGVLSKTQNSFQFKQRQSTRPENPKATNVSTPSEGTFTGISLNQILVDQRPIIDKRAAIKAGVVVLSGVALIGGSLVPDISSSHGIAKLKSSEGQTALDVESFITKNGRSFDIIDTFGKSHQSTISAPKCILDNTVPADFNFRGEGSQILDFNACSATLSLNGDPFDVDVLVEKRNEKLSNIWLILPRSSTNNDGAVRKATIVQLKDGVISLRNNDRLEIEVLKDLTGTISIYIEGKHADKSSSWWTLKQNEMFGNSSPVPQYFSRFVGMFERELPGIVDKILFANDSTEQEAPSYYPEGRNFLARPSSSEYKYEVYTQTDGDYPTELKDEVNSFLAQGNFESGLVPSSIIKIANPGFETLKVLNFSEEGMFDQRMLASAYAFFLNQAAQGRIFQYEDITFQVKLPSILNTVIGILPSKTTNNYPYTNRSFNQTQPNRVFFRLFDKEDLARAPHDVYQNINDLNLNFLVTEMCQATNRVVLTQNDSDPDRYEKLRIAQEIYCNSLGLAYFLRSAGYSYKDYAAFINERVKYNLGGGPIKYAGIVFDPEIYNQIPFSTNLFAAK